MPTLPSVQPFGVEPKMARRTLLAQIFPRRSKAGNVAHIVTDSQSNAKMREWLLVSVKFTLLEENSLMQTQLMVI